MANTTTEQFAMAEGLIARASRRLASFHETLTRLDVRGSFPSRESILKLDLDEIRSMLDAADRQLFS
jgi:hypothetical protein